MNNMGGSAIVPESHRHLCQQNSTKHATHSYLTGPYGHRITESTQFFHRTSSFAVNSVRMGGEESEIGSNAIRISRQNFGSFSVTAAATATGKFVLVAFNFDLCCNRRPAH